jgi:hypothetical protein
MPPRVRELKRLLREHGYVFERKGKGDHTIFFNPITRETFSLDGPDSHEVSPGLWYSLRKKLGLK